MRLDLGTTTRAGRTLQHFLAGHAPPGLAGSISPNVTLARALLEQWCLLIRRRTLASGPVARIKVHVSNLIFRSGRKTPIKRKRRHEIIFNLSASCVRDPRHIVVQMRGYEASSEPARSVGGRVPFDESGKQL